MCRGKPLRQQLLNEVILQQCFDRGSESTNKFDQLAVDELQEAVNEPANEGSARRVLIRRGKPEPRRRSGHLLALVAVPARAGWGRVAYQCRVFTPLPQLPCSTLTAINGNDGSLLGLRHKEQLQPSLTSLAGIVVSTSAGAQPVRNWR